VCVDRPALRALSRTEAEGERERERRGGDGGRDAERKMGLREDAAESRMKKKVEEGSLLLPPFNFFFLCSRIVCLQGFESPI
jgi:hypothetical protein